MKKLRENNDPTKEKIIWNGIPIHVEWPRGSVREYKDENGKITFSKKMFCSYGYIHDTDSSDGDEIDCYVGDNSESDTVFKVDQLVGNYGSTHGEGKLGEHDEYKYMLGFSSQDEADKCYKKHMNPEQFGGSKPILLVEFKKKIKNNMEKIKESINREIRNLLKEWDALEDLKRHVEVLMHWSKTVESATKETPVNTKQLKVALDNVVKMGQIIRENVFGSK